MKYSFYYWVSSERTWNWNYRVFLTRQFEIGISHADGQVEHLPREYTDLALMYTS